MKRKLCNSIKKGAALLLALAVAASSSGCQYDSVDDYLEALGMKDNDADDNDHDPKSSDDATAISSIFEPIEGLLEEAEKSLSENAEKTGIGPQDESAVFASSFASAYSSSEASASEVSSVADSADVASSSASDTGATESSAASSASSASQASSSLPPGQAADAGFQQSYTAKNAADKNLDDKAAREAIGLTEQGIEAKKKEQSGNYAYERLTDSGKTLYVEILAILQNLGEGIVVSTTSIDAIKMVFDYVMLDHPEIFYVTACKYTNYTVDNNTTKIAFSGIYAYGPEEVQRRQSVINSSVNQCLAGAPSSQDDYYKIKYVYEYLITNTDYEPGAEDNQNICSVFINRKSVCNGYAKAAQLLLNKLGISCTLVTGTVETRKSSSERHAWNLVKCNNQYYYLDVTWGDVSYQTVSGESADITKLPPVNYDYLNVTTAEIRKKHTLPDYIYMPECNSMTDNYYVREGNYFTSPELSLVADLFNRGYSNGDKYVTIKCANDSVYQTLFDELVTNRKVFGYLQGQQNTIAYTTFDETDTIIFWI